MAAGSLEEDQAATIAAYLASILKYCHKNGIILRNLRTETIVFAEPESHDVKLVDLSLAIEKWTVRDDQPDPLFDHYSKLSPVFRAPELFGQKKSYSEQVDVLVFGCIIFNMFAGIPPFYESDISALKNLIFYGQYSGYFPQFDACASEDLRELVAQMIVPNPSKRLTSDDIIANKWINSAHQKYRQLSRSVVVRVFKNMRAFRIGYDLQRAVLMQMAKTDIGGKELETLKMIFDALDEEKDGEIELKEFVIQLYEKFDIRVKVNEMEAIMKQADLDYDGKV